LLFHQVKLTINHIQQSLEAYAENHVAGMVIEKLIGQFLGLIVISHDLVMFELEFEVFRLFYLYLIHVENCGCLFCGVQVAGAAWRVTTRIVTEVGDLVQRIKNGHTGRVLVTGQLKGRVTPCAVCTVHVETMSVGFLVEPQNQDRRFVSGLTSKSLGRFSPVWPQNRW
jgi:hypothetical protein